MKIKKKRITKMFCAILSIFVLLVGCGSQKVNEKEEIEKEEVEQKAQYADEKFKEDISKGLQERWKLNSEDEAKEGYANIDSNSEEYKKMMINYIDAELNAVEKYEDEKFENSNLKELAIRYINLLNKHKELCQYLTVDFTKYQEESLLVYNERSKIISEMVRDYGMTVSEDYQSILNEFLSNANLVNEREAQNMAVEEMLSAVVFEESLDEGYGWKTYQGIIENTTGRDFDNMSFSINLLDADGVIVETTYDQIVAFVNGAKARLEFITDKEFVSTQIRADWWE